SVPDVMGETERPAIPGHGPDVSGGGKGLGAAGGMLKPLSGRRIADGEDVLLGASGPLPAHAAPQPQPCVACGAEGVLCIDGTACGVGVACGKGRQDDGVEVRVALQRGGDGLQLAGGGVENGVDLI